MYQLKPNFVVLHVNDLLECNVKVLI